jgi:hypothetical protein
VQEFWQVAIVDPLREFWQQVMLFLPHLVLSLMIVVLGLIVAWVLRELVSRGLRLAGFDRLAERHGVSTALERVAGYHSASHFVGQVVMWIVVLGALLAGLNALDTTLTSGLVARLVGYLPHLLIAGFILLLGSLISRFLARAVLLAAVNAQMRAASVLSGLVRFLVMALAAVAALEHLGIGQATVLVAFGIIFGGIVLALAIAFGLGGRDLARDLLEGQLRRRRREEEEEEGVRHL